MIIEVIESALSLGAFGLVFGAGLSLASKKLAVWTDPKELEVLAVLPGVNCGACGFPGCSGLAHAIASGIAEPNACMAGGASVTKAVARVMGVDAVVREKKVARPICGGGTNARERFKYDGIGHCKAAILVSSGFKDCTYGCLGLGSCKIVCPFNAIEIGEDHLPKVNPERCTGCGKCVEVCPKNIMELTSFDKNKVFVLCRSQDKGKIVKEKCSVGCIACRFCEKSCPYKSIIFENNLARVNYSTCRNCGVCAAKCTPKSILDTVPPRIKAFITPKCNGCGTCAKVCAFKAPVGEEKKLFTITEEKCIGCGVCIEQCPEKAIIRKI